MRAYAVKTVQAVPGKLYRHISSFSYPLIYQSVKASENAPESRQNSQEQRERREDDLIFVLLGKVLTGALREI
jgi:hypothetical protein